MEPTAVPMACECGGAGKRIVLTPSPSPAASIEECPDTEKRSKSIAREVRMAIDHSRNASAL